jgi:ATP-binding cassette subfamily C protein LapB
LSDGYETLISEGGKQLSGGQRQAICIARAFVGDPKIIIMDEPSSAMDSGSEQQLLEILKEKLVNKTLILITHRGTLLSLVSRVVVFDQGRILADGPKDKVLQAASQKAQQKPPEESQDAR